MIDKREYLTQEILKELIYYDPDTGIFTWKERDVKWFKSKGSHAAWNTRFAGNQAGTVHIGRNKEPYREIGIYYMLFKGHRLAVLYMTGKFPLEEVDHEDGNGLNNKWSNLREVSHLENSKNKRLQSNNSSGYSGVSYDNTKKKYLAKMGNEHLGYFLTLEEAVLVRKEAEIKYNYHPNHGKERQYEIK